ncbi:MAG: hypothetical protein KDK70_39575 [Myxococcales bacterium]|nr:hypothetical protein [Myxococcales bacterium]
MLGSNWIGALIALGTAIYSAQKQNEAQNASDARFAEAMRMVQELYPRQQTLLKRQEGYLSQIVDLVRQGSEKEQRIIGAVGHEAVRQIRDAQKVAASRGYQGLAARGYYGSSIAGAVSRGAAYDAERATGSLYENLAVARANASARGTAAEAGALGALANFQGYKAAAEQELKFQEAGLLVGRQTPFNTDIYKNIGAAGAGLDDWLGSSTWAQKYLGYSETKKD